MGDIETNVHKVRSSIAELIINMGWCEDDNFIDTPKRYVNWLSGMHSNAFSAKQACDEYFKSTFKTNNDEMVSVGPMRVYSMCPHHMLPIIYDVSVGVVLDGLALGLSKYVRVARELGKYPFIQEQYTKVLMDIFNEKLKSKGTMVIVDGEHLCMKARGVEDMNAKTITSKISGVFCNPAPGKDPKGEFMSIVLRGKS